MSVKWSLLLKQYRLRYGLNQSQMADLVGVSQRTVSRWERGEDKPNRRKLQFLRELGLEPPISIYSSLATAVRYCPASRALSTKKTLRLICLSDAAIKKRPSIVDNVGQDLLPLATGVLQEMLDDRELQKNIMSREVACVVSNTRSVLRTPESNKIGNFTTTISYFTHDGTLYSDAISLPAPEGTPCGYRAVPVMHV